MRFCSLQTARALALMLLALATAAVAQPKDAAPEKPKILEGLPAGSYAWFKTNHGEFVAKLFTDKTPIAVENFTGLANGTKTFIDVKTNQPAKRPFYDGVIFHRIIDGFMIQGGDPTGTGTGSPGYKFDDEINPDQHFDRPGLLAMANSGPNTNGCQFFITVAPYPSLDGHYVMFGEIAKGMDEVIAISKVPCDTSDPQSPRPLKPVVMEKVRVFQVAAPAKAAEGKPGDAKTR